MKIDFYVATVKGVEAFELARQIQEVGQGAWDLQDAAKKARQYQHAMALVNLSTERTEGFIRFGGNGGGVNVDFSGEASSAVGDFLRSEYKQQHSPSRMDICVDRRGASLFDDIVDHGMQLANASHPVIHTSVAGNWKQPELGEGRTIYFGSSSSEVQLVVYEKGLLLRKEGLPDAPADLVRLELRIRPSRSLRPWITSFDLQELWGARDFTKAMLERFTGLSVERFTIPDVKPGDEARFDAYCLQWGAHFLRWSQGDPAAFRDRVEHHMRMERHARKLGTG